MFGIATAHWHPIGAQGVPYYVKEILLRVFMHLKHYMPR